MDEYVLGCDKKQEAKVFKGIEGDKINIVRLILMEPGTIPTHPLMGVGLTSKYRYKTCEDIKASLANNIKIQLNRYMPHLIEPTVNVAIINTTGNHENIIQITVSSLMSSMSILIDESTRTTLESLA